MNLLDKIYDLQEQLAVAHENVQDLEDELDRLYTELVDSECYTGFRLPGQDEWDRR